MKIEGNIQDVNINKYNKNIRQESYIKRLNQVICLCSIHYIWIGISIPGITHILSYAKWLALSNGYEGERLIAKVSYIKLSHIGKNLDGKVRSEKTLLLCEVLSGIVKTINNDVNILCCSITRGTCYWQTNICLSKSI